MIVFKKIYHFFVTIYLPQYLQMNSRFGFDVFPFFFGVFDAAADFDFLIKVGPSEWSGVGGKFRLGAPCRKLKIGGVTGLALIGRNGLKTREIKNIYFDVLHIYFENIYFDFFEFQKNSFYH